MLHFLHNISKKTIENTTVNTCDTGGIGNTPVNTGAGILEIQCIFA